jgi:hypothetical protein
MAKGKLTKKKTISWPKMKWQKTDNIMAKEKLTKDRQYDGERWSDKRYTISWPKLNWQKTDNIMAKDEVTENRQYHGQRWSDKW